MIKSLKSIEISTLNRNTSSLERLFRRKSCFLQQYRIQWPRSIQIGFRLQTICSLNPLLFSFTKIDPQKQNHAYSEMWIPVRKNTYGLTNPGSIQESLNWVIPFLLYLCVLYRKIGLAEAGRSSRCCVTIWTRALFCDALPLRRHGFSGPQSVTI